MNHTLLSCQHGAVLARRSWLQDTRVSLLLLLPLLVHMGSRDSQGSSEGWWWSGGICTFSTFLFDGDVYLAKVL